MEPVFWKLSMRPGDGNDFPDLLHVLDWLRQGFVLVHKNTPPMGKSENAQGADFVDKARIGDYFYLCHGNRAPSVILLGQFTGPADILSPFILTNGDWKDGWAPRTFRWIKTALRSAKYRGDRKWWTPIGNSTFIRIKQEELGEFEETILQPYFDVKLADFGINAHD